MAIVADSDNPIRDRYQGAYELWAMSLTEPALAAYRLLSETPGADRTAMRQAIDAIVDVLEKHGQFDER